LGGSVTPYVFAMGENFHPEAEGPCNNPYHAENIWLVMFLRTFGRGRPLTAGKLLAAVYAKHFSTTFFERKGRTKL
jgi:hypothetical protein